MRLTPLEIMFVQEFCRFAGVPLSEALLLEAEDRERNPAGFVTTVTPSSVPPLLYWGHQFFAPDRLAAVGPGGIRCAMLLVFDRKSGRLDTTEGDVFEADWPDIEDPAFWSETDRITDLRRKS